MTNSATFGDLIGLLESLGFDCTRRVNGQVVCEHPPSDTMILLAERPAGERVRDQILFGVRLQLDQRGLLARDEFDRQLADVAARNGANGAATARKGKPAHRS